VPPRFRVRTDTGVLPGASDFAVETVRPDGSRQLFSFENRGEYLQSREEIPEPHAFLAAVRLVEAGRQHQRELQFEEHEHGDGAHHRDNNMRAAVVHVMADAAVSVLVIAGLVMARAFGWLWMDPLAGLIGAAVIANWSVGLLRDTGGILLDRMPDPRIAEKVRNAIESEGDQVTDLHLWRLGPGHLGAIVSVATSGARDAAHYRQRLARFADLSHVTVEVQHSSAANRQPAL
jgi:cation diffusion facilitator family transporter